jgi:hypothetical protein
VPLAANKSLPASSWERDFTRGFPRAAALLTRTRVRWDELIVDGLVQGGREDVREAVDALADNSKAFEQFEDRLDEIIQPSATILMASEPGLSGVLADLREWMYYFENILEGYREVRGSSSGKDVAKQACVQLKEVMIEADRVRRWLAAHAEGIVPADRNRRK